MGLALLTLVDVRPSEAQARPEVWDTQGVLDLRIEADFRTIRTDDRHAGAPLRYGTISVGADSTRTPVFIRTRGNLRLQRSVCTFPPLRLQIATDSIRGGAIPDELRGLGNARVVSSCRNGQDHLVHLEYLAYRIYAVLSDRAYAVRPFRATYVDATGRDGIRTTAAFLLESDGHLARRLGVQLIDDTLALRVDPAILEAKSAAVLDAFQYLIGNTDWSVSARHNILLTQQSGRFVAIPYDFDSSGLVNAPYAAPDRRLPIENVTQRLFRGQCRADAEFSEALQLILSRREAILAEIDALEGLSDFRRGRARRYVEDFFREVSSGRTLRVFRGSCR